MDHEHHHAHGPANRRRLVLTTAAPLFLCEPVADGRRGAVSTAVDAAVSTAVNTAVSTAVVALHGPRGITAEFERGLRAVAASGCLVAAPFHYFRDGGPEYVTGPSARAAYAALAEDDIDADVDAAIEHVVGRLRLPVVAVLGPTSVAAAVRRAGDRHPAVASVVLPDLPGAPDPGGDSATGDAPPAEWLAAVEHLGAVGHLGAAPYRRIIAGRA
jgi:carboxymethylenebutenolidase